MTIHSHLQRMEQRKYVGYNLKANLLRSTEIPLPKQGLDS